MGILAVLLALSAAMGSAASAVEPLYFDLLSTDSVAAFEFVKKHPEWDGRGAVVAVLDTGVDMSVPGLTATSTGEQKVIEARDFSGQGNVRLKKPRVVSERGEQVLELEGHVLHGYDRMSPKPPLETVWVGTFSEERFRNSAVSDVNYNGTTRDEFGLLLGKVREGNADKWLLWVDTDGDGLVDDEKPVEDYSAARKHFFFVAGGRDDTRVSMAVAPQLVPEKQEVIFHFPDGSHGSHVAGIATGHKLFGKPGFNGIAPGAKVMSLKIGDNTLSGGSTTSESMKRALEFAGDWSEKNSTPVVVNMSYGIGSESEGSSDIDRLTDDLVRKYPLLSVATSAGNSGPGLSSVGTPAGALLAFSTGALLTKANAKSLYGASIDKDVIFYFSSRGGELGKPDGLAPGVAASQVPPWEGWIVMRGTSMASPQAAGCLALLASAAVQQKEKLRFNGGMLVRSLRNSGRHLDDQTLVDQGGGVVNVPDAWESLKKLASRPSAEVIAGFRVSGDCPTCPGGSAQTAFFRAGTWLPRKPEAVSFSVSPVFMSKTPPGPKESYFETVDLDVEGGDWLHPASSTMVFRKEGSVSLDAFIDVDELKAPGVHSALVRGVSREAGRTKGATLFELWAVVVVPYVFDMSNGYARRFDEKGYSPGEVFRYFVRVPEGAGSMRIELAPSKSKYASSQVALFDPDGREYEFMTPYADSRTGETGLVLVSKDDLEPGVWEVDVVTSYSARGDSFCGLAVTFSGFRYEAPEEFYYSMGSPARSQFSLQTLFDQVFEGRASAGLEGFVREQQYSSVGDTLEFPVTLDKGIVQARFDLSMDVADYSRMTDVSVTVTDGPGNAVNKTGFTTRFLKFTVENPNAGSGTESYTVTIRAALTSQNGEPWKVRVKEHYITQKRIGAKVWCDGYSYFTIYPNRTYNCELELDEVPQVAPEGFLYYGEIRLRDARTRRDALSIPLRLRAGQ